MDRYPCVNRYKHGVDCPGWVNVHNARCEDCVVTSTYAQIKSNEECSTTDSFRDLNGEQRFQKASRVCYNAAGICPGKSCEGHASAEIERKEGYHPHMISLQPASMLKE
ncbi:hypothetical protein ColKHC_10392 [Colletotrichum higginsianum]|nr:hypothetical protein ColKHC_10392 [Colletotrichum higginsianum]